MSLTREFEMALAKDDLRDMSRMEQEKARFAGCPPICESENLPSYASKTHAIDWLNAPNKTNPLYEAHHIKRLWECAH